LAIIYFKFQSEKKTTFRTAGLFHFKTPVFS